VDESLNNTLLFTHNPESPQLIETAVPILLKLIENTTPRGSEQRFEQLSTLLGKTIIGSLWVNLARDPPTITATYRSMPAIMNVLEMGTVRFLNVSSKYML
jgi:hypothetical protein